MNKAPKNLNNQFKNSMSKSNDNITYPKPEQHNSNNNNSTDNISALEKTLLAKTIRLVSNYRRDKANTTYHKLAENSLSTLLTINMYLDNDSNQTGRLSKAVLTAAKTQIEQGDLSDALITLLKGRDKMYGLPNL